ncbi:MAG: C25 family cysteine peptidase, partial [Anaerolineales bacterium]
MMERSDLLILIQASKTSGRLGFARAVAADWLATWPGDLQVQYLLAELELDVGLHQAAIERLQKVVLIDPEHEQAYKLLALALDSSSDSARASIYAACAQALRGVQSPSDRAPSWASPLGRAIRALNKGDAATAIQAASEAAQADLELPLSSLTCLQAYLAAQNQQAALEIAQAANEKWPESIPFRLLIAQDLLARGDTNRGVLALHQIVADDPLGWITRRILGAGHPYKDLWPQALSASLNRPIPKEVADILGAKQLTAQAEPAPANEESPKQDSHAKMPHPSEASEVADPPPPQPTSSPRKVGKPQPPIPHMPPATELPKPMPWESFRGPDPGDDTEQIGPETSPELDQARAELDQLAQSLNMRIRNKDEDDRLPAYIVLSARTPLARMLGEDRAQRIDAAITSLVEAVSRRRGWTAYHIFVDDPKTLKPFDLAPVDPANAWQIKLRLADLDRALANRGEMIGSLLIVGNHQIVPFHMLPNPTDDDDDAIPSDNPYATLDENYLAPEWPVGRLPSDDAELLVRLLQASTQEHHDAARKVGPLRRLRLWIWRVLWRWLYRHTRSMGYSASIWRKASMAVFRTIGEPRAMVTSPPTEASTFPLAALRLPRFSYYNLHGLEDAPEWFGQRDPLRDTQSDIDYPIALRPRDVINSGRSPRVVFTEACFGANTLGKTTESALCLKFLDSGSRAVVGSTKISYGSVTPPLIAADLLGRLFWEYAKEAVPTGEALRRAKLKLAAEMHRRQGFLDGEDQKTIISFVL